MEGVQENAQQPEHATIVRIDGVRFGDGDMDGKVKFTTTEVVGEFAGTLLTFWCPMQNADGLLTPAMKLYELLEAGLGEGWTNKYGSVATAVQALRGRFVAGTSVKKGKGGIGNNLEHGSIKPVPEDFEPAA